VNIVPVPFWSDQPALYDAITIAGFTFIDTVVDVSGPRGVRIDAKNAPGTDGANESYLGYEPAKISIAWWIYTPEHFALLLDMMPSVMPRPGKTAPNPVDILYPMLELYGLRTFRVEKMHLPRKVKPQAYEVKLDCIEFFPTKKMGKATATSAAQQGLQNIFDGGNQNARPPGRPSADNTGPGIPTAPVKH
jgi:hypothetical protein